jgi:hypothetical protein
VLLSDRPLPARAAVVSLAVARQQLHLAMEALALLLAHLATAAEAEGSYLGRST